MDLASLRARHKLSQAELAEKIGVSPGHIGDIETDRRRLTVKVAAKIENVTGETGIVDAVVAAERGAA